jgi:hypothetical protein
MLDKFMYSFFGAIDKFFDIFIPSIYERLKNNRIFFKRKRSKK